MNVATELLVIILAVTLTVFLLVGIALMVYIMFLTRDIKRITLSAEKAVSDVGKAMTGVSKLVSPVYIVESIATIISKFKDKKGDKRNVKE